MSAPPVGCYSFRPKFGPRRESDTLFFPNLSKTTNRVDIGSMEKGTPHYKLTVVRAMIEAGKVRSTISRLLAAPH